VGDVWHQFKSHRGALWGFAIFVAILAFVFLGPFVYWNSATQVPTGRAFLEARDTRPIYTALWDSAAKVNWAYPLGTDQLGRDHLARLMFGGQVSIAVGLDRDAPRALLGTLIGVVAGFFRALDGPLMRLTDLFLALPLLPLLLVAVLLFREPLSATFGVEGGTFILIVTLIGITSWMQTARIVRGDILALKEREFILAARSIGTSPFGIIGATSCRTCCRRSWSRPRSASPPRSSPKARCPSSASGFRPTSRPGASSSSTASTGCASFPNG
jgi:peptide/nickel transport system permease protein